MIYNYNKKLSGTAKSLRKRMTPEEKHLWYDFLKKLPVVVNRQKNIGNFIVDFFIASARIAIEIDGIQHQMERDRRADQKRDEELSMLGIKVLRYTNSDINARFGLVCEDILKNIGISEEELEKNGSSIIDFNTERNTTMHYQIAIDGPSGAGKSTLAKAVAARLGIVYVDTGALYRTVGYFVKERGVDPKNASAVEGILSDAEIKVRYEDGVQRVYLNGVDLGDGIRTPEMSLYASAVSAIPAVRAFLLETQKEIARENSVIMDGRDIGTVILPDAEVKIFLTASAEARARRRYRELTEKGQTVRYEDVLREMELRDENDRNRDVAPAIPAEDALHFDNSGMTVEEGVDAVIRIVAERVPGAVDALSGANGGGV